MTDAPDATVDGDAAWVDWLEHAGDDWVIEFRLLDDDGEPVTPEEAWFSGVIADGEGGAVLCPLSFTVAGDGWVAAACPHDREGRPGAGSWWWEIQIDEPGQPRDTPMKGVLVISPDTVLEEGP